MPMLANHQLMEVHRHKKTGAEAGFFLRGKTGIGVPNIAPNKLNRDISHIPKSKQQKNALSRHGFSLPTARGKW